MAPTSLRVSLSPVILVLLVGGASLLNHSSTPPPFTSQQPLSSSFALTPSPNFTTVILGSSVTSNVTVSSLNGFSGTVTFSQPVTQAGISATISTYSVPVTPSNPGSTILNATVMGPIARDTHDCVYGCPYNVSITGSAGSSTEMAIVRILVYIPNFSFYSDRNLPIIQGKTISLIWVLSASTSRGRCRLQQLWLPLGRE